MAHRRSSSRALDHFTQALWPAPWMTAWGTLLRCPTQVGAQLPSSEAGGRPHPLQESPTPGRSAQAVCRA